MIDMCMGDNDKLDVPESQILFGKSFPYFMLGSRDAGIDQDTAVRSNKQIGVHHAQRQNRNTDYLHLGHKCE
ncbi:hypothetical protein D3C72_1959470 [compost metagenome]